MSCISPTELLTEYWPSTPDPKVLDLLTNRTTDRILTEYTWPESPRPHQQNYWPNTDRVHLTLKYWISPIELLTEYWPSIPDSKVMELTNITSDRILPGRVHLSLMSWISPTELLTEYSPNTSDPKVSDLTNRTTDRVHLTLKSLISPIEHLTEY